MPHLAGFGRPHILAAISVHLSKSRGCDPNQAFRSPRPAASRYSLSHRRASHSNRTNKSVNQKNAFGIFFFQPCGDHLTSILPMRTKLCRRRRDHRSGLNGHRCNIIEDNSLQLYLSVPTAGTQPTRQVHTEPHTHQEGSNSLLGSVFWPVGDNRNVQPSRVSSSSTPTRR